MADKTSRPNIQILWGDDIGKACGRRPDQSYG